MPTHPSRAARAALGNEQLRHNLGHATATIRAKRAAVVGEVTDWEELRRAAEAVKAATMARLDEHLVRLEEQVTARGGTVHWARDADEANRIIVDLVRATGAAEVVKVKSMATQEIGLNEALADASIAAWETDLAELIVQFGNDKPSHILVPAIHRNRAEICEIFLRAMSDVDPDLTDEPRELAMAARAHLRRKFLSAKVAVSGANFAVAETGTLAVVESEGNGRMCLTLPDTLITVMGIEKVIPTWTDLEVFLQLLPRSSTGERTNPYTSMWAGVTPGDGPKTFHLVLVDNGRTAVLSDPVGRPALHCIRCSACLNVCPVYERTGGHAYGSVYPGPIGAILTPMLTGVAENPSLPYASTLCGACFDVCPVRIDIPSILVHLRGKKVSASNEVSPEALTMAAASWVMESPRLFAAVERVSRLARLWSRRGRLSTLPPPLSSWTATRDLPAPPIETPMVASNPGCAMTARDEVLARIRSGLGVHPDEPDIPRNYRRAGDLTSMELLDLLTDRLLDYKATVQRGSVAELPAILWSLLDGPFLVPPGLPSSWALAEGTTDRGFSPSELDGFATAVTGCAAACAETGTIVLDGSPDQGRRAISLVPDRHVCVVRADQVVATVPELLARLDPLRPLTFISGPSATSDIELQRVEGVHGPRNLVVVLVTS